MNPEAEAILKKILAKEPHELTENDKVFLKARVAYVGRRSRERFADVFADKKPSRTEAREQKKQATAQKEQEVMQKLQAQETVPPYVEEDDEDED